MRRLPEGVKQFIWENVKGISNQELVDRYRLHPAGQEAVSCQAFAGR